MLGFGRVAVARSLIRGGLASLTRFIDKRRGGTGELLSRRGCFGRCSRAAAEICDACSTPDIANDRPIPTLLHAKSVSPPNTYRVTGRTVTYVADWRNYVEAPPCSSDPFISTNAEAMHNRRRQKRAGGPPLLLLHVVNDASSR